MASVALGSVFKGVKEFISVEVFRVWGLGYGVHSSFKRGEMRQKQRDPKRSEGHRHRNVQLYRGELLENGPEGTAYVQNMTCFTIPNKRWCIYVHVHACTCMVCIYLYMRIHKYVNEYIYIYI